MLMIYGLFVFSVSTAPFNERQHSKNWRWGTNNRVANNPAYQFIGKGDETITLNGTLMPEHSGGRLWLHLLTMMADSGKAWLLMGGNGEVFGYYFIESISETDSCLLNDGSPQKIDFTLSLKRYDGNSMLGNLSSIISETI